MRRSSAPRAREKIQEEMAAVCRSPEHGTLLVRGVRGCSLRIDGVPVELETLASTGASADYRAAGGGEALSIRNVCPGRHSIHAADQRGSFVLTLLLQPHEDAARTLTATGWHEPDARGPTADTMVLDYAEAIAPKMDSTALASQRVERALALFATAAGIVTGIGGPEDAALAPTTHAMEAALDAAPLTKETFASLIGRMSLTIEQLAQRRETIAPAAQLAEVALAVLSDDPRLLIRLAELESALGSEKAARAHVARARARPRADALVSTGFDEGLLARADAVIRE